MPEPLAGRGVLLVEDQYLIAEDFRMAIEDAGGTVLGPAGTVVEALALIMTHPGLDAAIVDLNLHGESAVPVIDAILAMERPMILTTGYDEGGIHERHRRILLRQKPLVPAELVLTLAQLLDA